MARCPALHRCTSKGPICLEREPPGAPWTLQALEAMLGPAGMRLHGEKKRLPSVDHRTPPQSRPKRQQLKVWVGVGNSSILTGGDTRHLDRLVICVLNPLGRASPPTAAERSRAELAERCRHGESENAMA